MLLTTTVSTEAAGDALGLRPAAIRERIKDGRLVAARVGSRWRVHAASINALLGGTSSSSPETAAQLDVEAVPIFDDADEPFIMRCEMLRVSPIPEHAKVGAWMVAKHKRFARSCAVPQPALTPAFDPLTAFAKRF